MRFVKRKIATRTRASHGGLNIGYVPTIDCAILMAAEALGLYRKYGLNVKLTREVGWATIREKLLHEELDAAGAHASIAISIYCGIGVVRRACLTGLLLSANGSAITLSNELWAQGVRDAATLGQYVRGRKGARKLSFGAVLELSSQNYNLRHWLRSGGIDPDRDVEIPIIPSTLVYDSFREGYLDGYCVAEPWNTVAVDAKTGWVAALSSELNPTHPEKVLLVLQEFAEQREEEHLQLIAALIEASQYCDLPANRPELARILSQSQYLDIDEAILKNSLTGTFDTGRSRRSVPDFVTFDAFKVGSPSRAMGRRVYDLVKALGLPAECTALNSGVIAKVFREDIFQQAVKKHSLVPPAGLPPLPAVLPELPAHTLASTANGVRHQLQDWAASVAALADPAALAPLCSR